jgi:DNA-binding NarL/FixJ family response regulator
MEPISIHIVDNHNLIRKAWTFILNLDPRFRVIAESETGESAVELAVRLRPDIVIMDINLQGINGFEATEQILRRAPGTKILGLSFYLKPAYARKLVEIGAMGYISKNCSPEEIFKALVEVNKGNKYICEEINHILSEDLKRDGDSENDLLSSAV